HSSLIAVGPAHRSRADSLHARTFIDISFGDDQRVYVDVVIAVLGVGDGRPQHFFDGRGDALVDGAENMNRLAGLLAADQIDDQARFLRRGSEVSGFGSGLHLFALLRTAWRSFRPPPRVLPRRVLPALPQRLWRRAL